jgi:hypothetical protein
VKETTNRPKNEKQHKGQYHPWVFNEWREKKPATGGRLKLLAFKFSPHDENNLYWSQLTNLSIYAQK